MLRTGIQTIAYFKAEAYEKGFEKVKAHGYDCVDYNLADPTLSFYSFSESEYEIFLKKTAECAERNGIEIFQAHGLWAGDMVADTPEKRAEHIRWYKKQIRGAACLQCKNLVIHPCMPLGWWGERKDHDAILQYNLDELAALMPTAEEYGVAVCVENLPLGIATSAFVKEIVTAANHKYVKACFDTGHANMQREDIYQSVVLLGEDLRVLHVHDNNKRDDAHAIPFQYNLDWNGFLKGLNEIGYKGCMSMETRIPEAMPQPMREQMQMALAGIAKYLAEKVNI